MMAGPQSLRTTFFVLHLLVLWIYLLGGTSAFSTLLPPSNNRPCTNKKDGEAYKIRRSRRDLSLSARNKEDGYRFGDITRSVLGKAKKDVNSLTGKSEYEFGDFSRWLDKQGRTKVSELMEGITNKPDYEFGDLSREVIRRLQAGEYNSEDVWLLLKIVALVGINIQPVASILPIRVVVQLLEASVAQHLSEKVVGTLAGEVDSRMKEFVTGDKNYKLGDFTKQALTGNKNYQFGDLTKSVLKKVVGKESYQFGDITRNFLNHHKDSSNDRTPDNSTGLLNLDAETKKALEDWDKKYLEAKTHDAIAKLELGKWDEKFLEVASKEGKLK